MNAGRERRDGGRREGKDREGDKVGPKSKLGRHVDPAAALLISPVQHLFGDLARCALTPCPNPSGEAALTRSRVSDRPV